MPTFLFKFDTVLRHRKMIEDQRQRELAQVVRLRMILLDQLRQMQQTISQSKHDLGQGLVGQVNVEGISGFARYAGQVTQRAQQLVTRLADVERDIEADRQRLLQATKARKAMDLLRERHLATWQREEDRRETATLDELSVQAYARNLVQETAQ